VTVAGDSQNVLQVLLETSGLSSGRVYVYEGFLTPHLRQVQGVITVEVGRRGGEGVSLLKIMQHLVQTLLELAAQGTEVVDPSEGTEADILRSCRVVLERDLLVHMECEGHQTITKVSRGIGAYGSIAIVLFSSKGLVEAVDESPPLFKGILIAIGLKDPIRQGKEILDLVLEAPKRRERRRCEGPLEEGQAGCIKVPSIAGERFVPAIVPFDVGGHMGTRIVKNK
jgi:hypothetical protein